MKVRFYALNTTTAEVDHVGTLTDGQLVADPPDSIALRNIQAEPVRVYLMDAKPDELEYILIDPTTQPEAFLKACHKDYNGSYFWAGEVED
jgi:hypothetical protein